MVRAVLIEENFVLKFLIFLFFSKYVNAHISRFSRAVKFTNYDRTPSYLDPKITSVENLEKNLSGKNGPKTFFTKKTDKTGLPPSPQPGLNEGNNACTTCTTPLTGHDSRQQWLEGLSERCGRPAYLSVVLAL